MIHFIANRHSSCSAVVGQSWPELSQSQREASRPELSHQTAPQTPQTPSSIPDIVLQGLSPILRTRYLNSGISWLLSFIVIPDFSNTSQDHNAHDLGSAMGASFDGVDFYPTDDALRGDIRSIMPIYKGAITIFFIFFAHFSRWTRSPLTLTVCRY